MSIKPKPLETRDEGNDTTVRTKYGEIEEIHDDLQIYFMKFKRFDVFESPPPDHHYLYQSSSSGFCLGQIFEGSFAERMREEWAIFGPQVPKGIFVRVYKATMDVTRVAIVAERDSSYHHGLFFFDIRFPRAYPLKPPQLFYNSFGDSHYSKILNPKGKVRLELFDEWSPLVLSNNNRNSRKKSALFEVLVFIQRLILLSPRDNTNNANPSRIEKKDSMMRTFGAMFGMLRSAPKGFEGFIVGYYRTRAHRILTNFKSSVDISSDKDLRLLFFRVVRAFEKIGTYCKHHYDQRLYDQALQEERTYVNPFNDEKVGCI